MKKPGKLFPMFLLCCTLIFAAGCGTNKKNDQNDMANNNATTENSGGQVDGNDTQMGTEAFDGTGTDDFTAGDPENGTADTITGNGYENGVTGNGVNDGLTNNGTLNGTGNTANRTGNTVGNAADNAGNAVGNAVDDAGNTVGNVVDDVGNAAGNIIDDAGDAVGNVAKDIGDGISDLTGSDKNNSATSGTKTGTGK